MNIAEIKETWRDRRKRKPYLTALLLAALYVGEIFFLSVLLARIFGVLGTVIHEIVLAGIGVVTFLILKGRMKVIFPLKKPEVAKVAGTLILWLGTWLFTLMVNSILLFFFTEQMEQANGGVDEIIMRLPWLVSVFVIAVTPAVCEEIAFRGALLSCFRGAKNRWIGIIVVSLFFGACHGSLLRMIPTAMLGVAMGYILLETENMIYNMLFHFVNNLVPVVLLGVANLIERLAGGSRSWETEISNAAGYADSFRIPLASVGMLMFYAGGAPLLIYIGNYLLHRGRPGYEKGLFPPEKKKQMMILMGAGGAVMAIGLLLAAVSIGLETAGMMRYMQ